jgi:ribosomal-protein-alanine N-acetyltransferase
MPDLSLHPVGVLHADVLAALHAAAFAHPWTAKALSQLLDTGAEALLAQKGDLPCGFILVRHAAGEAEILTLAVTPDHRGLGIGAALVEAARKQLEATQVQDLWLEVAEDNTAARRLYESAGFEPVGRRRGYYETSEGRIDALVLRLKLTSA